MKKLVLFAMFLAPTVILVGTFFPPGQVFADKNDDDDDDDDDDKNDDKNDDDDKNDERGRRRQRAPQGITVNAKFFTSFEGFSPDKSDVTDFYVGDVLFTNKDADVAAAATRGFRPGYRTGAFVWLTANGTSVLEVRGDDPNRMHFFAKRIAELNPDVKGKLVVTFLNGRVKTIKVKKRFTGYLFKNVREVEVVTDGITNIDDFTFYTKKINQVPEF